MMYFRDTVGTRVIGGVVGVVFGTGLVVGRNLYGDNLDATSDHPDVAMLQNGVSLLIVSLGYAVVVAGLYNFGRAVWLAATGRW